MFLLIGPQCDQEKPACARCVKAGRVCPGYRDPLNLSFRDESQDVIRKARVRPRSPVQSTSRRAFPVFETSTGVVRSGGSNAKPPPADDLGLTRRRAPSVSVTDQATCFFFSNFVVADMGLSKSHLNHVTALIQLPGNGALAATVAAVGMAGLANTRAAPQVMVAARENYAKALRLINAALRDPIESKTNQTLSAVLLLGLFEVSGFIKTASSELTLAQIFTCNNEQSMESWTNHIDGAAALLRFRGPEQLRTRIGLTMFMQCRAQIVCVSSLIQSTYNDLTARQLISSLQRRLKANVPIVDWDDLGQYYPVDVELPAHRLSVIVARISNLRAAVFTKVITDCSSIVLSFLSIEAALSEWVMLLPPQWTFTTVDTTTESGADYGRQRHVYEDIWIASVWNSYRCVRMLCNEEILGHLRRLPSPPSLSTGADYSAQARMSRSILNQLASEICTSVTFHLGQPKVEDGRLLFQCRALYGIHLLWPLYIAGNVSETPRSRRSWVTDVLDGIGYSLGIRQASALAQMLRVGMDISTRNDGLNDREGSSNECIDSANGAEDEASIPQRTKYFPKFAALTRDHGV